MSLTFQTDLILSVVDSETIIMSVYLSKYTIHYLYYSPQDLRWYLMFDEPLTHSSKRLSYLRATVILDTFSDPICSRTN